MIVQMHEVVLDISGGKSGFHRETNVHRAAERPLTYISYVESFDVDTVCAILIDAIAVYHGFNDGNKRTALMTAIFTYRINGVHFRATIAMNKEFDALVIWVVRKKPTIPEIEARLKKLRDKFEAAKPQSITTMFVSFIKMRTRKETAKNNQ